MVKNLELRIRNSTQMIFTQMVTVRICFVNCVVEIEIFPLAWYFFTGRLGIVDYDEVELTNLHRQILHTEGRVGMAKSSSIANSCTQ